MAYLPVKHFVSDVRGCPLISITLVSSSVSDSTLAVHLLLFAGTLFSKRKGWIGTGSSRF